MNYNLSINAPLIINATQKEINFGYIAKNWFDVLSSLSTTTLIGNTSYETVYDVKSLFLTADSFINNVIISAFEIRKNTLENVTFSFSALNPEIATLSTSDYNCLTEYVNNGNSLINIKMLKENEVIKERNYSFYVNKIIGNNERIDYEFIEPSFGWDVTKSFVKETSGINASDLTKKVFTTQDHENSIYVRNNNCWGYNFDWSGVSPWNSFDQVRRAGVLISPRHILFAQHYPIPIGTTLRFITNDNQVVNKTLINTENVIFSNDIESISTDLTVGLLDSDVPNSIKYYKILDSDRTGRLSTNTTIFPIAYFDQEEKLLIGKLNGGMFPINDEIPQAFLAIYVFIKRFFDFSSALYPNYYNKFLEFYETVIEGDSGNPFFFIINDEPVLLTLAFGKPSEHSTVGVGTSRVKDGINQAMLNLGGGYQLSLYDTSSYPIYPW